MAGKREHAAGLRGRGRRRVPICGAHRTSTSTYSTRCALTSYPPPRVSADQGAATVTVEGAWLAQPEHVLRQDSATSRSRPSPLGARRIGDASVSLHPAGHMLGSRCSARRTLGRIWPLVVADYVFLGCRVSMVNGARVHRRRVPRSTLRGSWSSWVRLRVDGPSPPNLAANPQAEATVRVIEHDAPSPAPDIDPPLRRLFQRPADAVARAVAWGFIRTFSGLLAAGLLVCYAYTSG